MSTSIAATIESDSAEQAQSAKPALLALMSSEGAQILSHALVAEPYSSGTMRPGASKAVLHLVSRVPRRGGLPERHREVTKRPSDACARLQAAICIFGRSSGRTEHRAGTLCKSTADTFNRISRGHGLEGHEHSDCNPGRALPVDTSEDARRKRKTGTARAHELGLS